MMLFKERMGLMPKYIVLHASPRLNGNSHTLAETFITGAEAAGNWVKRTMSRWLKWNLVLPANTAARMNTSAVKMMICKRSIHRSSVLTALFWQLPLYFYDWPAQLKLVIDRLYAFGPQYQIRHKETALLMTAADKDPQAFSGAEKSYELALVDYLQWKDRGRILVNGVNAAGSTKIIPLW